MTARSPRHVSSTVVKDKYVKMGAEAHLKLKMEIGSPPSSLHSVLIVVDRATCAADAGSYDPCVRRSHEILGTLTGTRKHFGSTSDGIRRIADASLEGLMT
ncbi:hypothetical protein SKAU_G00204260 [Synaphobranchus kaupii]|uniref:Uncharacterized protein n=1 Tax=Synaphobranchus kaupii TaxID=118154 RepID=A0A9Q1FGD9_SYNKA|nr:hypothetical protein SKAU_G00204260 [Synaphobranchus kaupii]